MIGSGLSAGEASISSPNKQKNGDGVSFFVYKKPQNKKLHRFSDKRNIAFTTRG